MEIGFVGLGKMGTNMVSRLSKNNHQIIVYDRSLNAIDKAVKNGAIASNSLEDMVNKLPERKVIWLMIPAGKPVEETVKSLENFLNEDDIIIDGGNSFWKDTIERSKQLSKKGIRYLDCGVSGGIWGLENGYGLMSGGDKESSKYIYPIFEVLAPKGGYVYCGESGSGHFVKMVHNGIEYGMMQSYAEGFEIMEKSPFSLNLTKISDAWQYGTVIRSWLLELAVLAFQEDPKLDKIKGYVSDSGEGRWTIQAAIDLDVPAHVITAALFNRFQSRQDDSFAMKVLAALRNQFGGHAVKTKEN